MAVNLNSQVLVVEDDHINAFIVKKFLDGEFDVKLAMNGTVALEYAVETNFDVVLMDINLGDDELDGVEVLHRMRKMNGYTSKPIIATTAYAMSGDRERFLEAGFDAYLPKPIKRDDLIATIQEKLNLAAENG
jgi:two-component system cell cycle response regulator DivK